MERFCESCRHCSSFSIVAFFSSAHSSRLEIEGETVLRLGWWIGGADSIYGAEPGTDRACPREGVGELVEPDEGLAYPVLRGIDFVVLVDAALSISSAPDYGGGAGGPRPVGCPAVHRLDEGCSGVLVIDGV